MDESALLVAVLRQAIEDARLRCAQVRYVRRIQHLRLRDEARRFILSNDPRPMGFVWICDCLGLHEDFVRRRIGASAWLVPEVAA